MRALMMYNTLLPVLLFLCFLPSLDLKLKILILTTMNRFVKDVRDSQKKKKPSYITAL